MIFRRSCLPIGREKNNNTLNYEIREIGKNSAAPRPAVLRDGARRKVVYFVIQGNNKSNFND